MADNKILDVAIIGAGPGGLTAAIYAGRSGMAAKVFDKMGPGGQAAMTNSVENYPGFAEPVSGADLAMKIAAQAEKFAGPPRLAEIEAVEPAGDGSFAVKTSEGEVRALSVVVAGGARWKKLGCGGEEEFTGRGVSYCAVCDGPFYRGKPVAVVGGGNSALDEASYLAQICEKVYLIHRRDRFRADQVLQDQCLAHQNVVPVMSSVVEEIYGAQFVEGIKVKNVTTGGISDIKTEGVFIFVGIAPNSEFLKGTVDLDANGFVITDQEMQTSAPGIFAAGDVRVTSLRQIVTACGDGATAAMSAYKYVQQLKGTLYPGLEESKGK